MVWCVAWCAGLHASSLGGSLLSPEPPLLILRLLDSARHLNALPYPRTDPPRSLIRYKPLLKTCVYITQKPPLPAHGDAAKETITTTTHDREEHTSGRLSFVVTCQILYLMTTLFLISLATPVQVLHTHNVHSPMPLSDKCTLPMPRVTTGPNLVEIKWCPNQDDHEILVSR